MFHSPKSKDLHWTYHARAKMNQYRLSESRVRRVMHAPKRVEEGIAPKTVAFMQPASLVSSKGAGEWNQEIWVMAQEIKGKRKIISAWRYPGKTKPGSALPLEILREIKSALIS